MMMLWQDGAFKLDEPVAPHLDFAVVNPHAVDTRRSRSAISSRTHPGISDAIYYDLEFSSGPLPSLRIF